MLTGAGFFSPQEGVCVARQSLVELKLCRWRHLYPNALIDGALCVCHYVSERYLCGYFGSVDM